MVGILRVPRSPSVATAISTSLLCDAVSSGSHHECRSPGSECRWTGHINTSSLLYHAVPELALIGIGLGLIGIYHLPIRFGGLVGVIAVAGVDLAFLRAHRQWFPDVSEMWVILGSMFMFRLMVYLYDLKHRTAPFSPARAVAYFFMLPNVCFALFPVVDYKTFCSTYSTKTGRASIKAASSGCFAQ